MVGFREGLRDHGWVEGRDVVIDERFVGREPGSITTLLRELIALGADVLVVTGNQGALEARQLSATTPIVMAVSGDVVQDGLVASLARPGGTITGVSRLNRQLSAKRLELLAESAPGLSRVGVLWTPTGPQSRDLFEATSAAARQLGLPAISLETTNLQDIEVAVQRARAAAAEGLVLVIGAWGTNDGRRQLLDLVTRHRLPAMYPIREVVEDGGLMAYTENTVEMYRRAAYYVDRILRGAKPADLPIEQPSRYDFVAHRGAAEAIGFTFAPAALLQVTEWIG